MEGVRKTRSRMFTAMVIGDNHEEIMANYNMAKKVEPYIKYRYLDASKIKAKTEKIIETILEDPKKLSLNEFQIDAFREKLNVLKGLSPFEYYTSLTNGLYYDEEGNALTDENPQGKWATCEIAKNFATPMILLDGTETFQARKRDIDQHMMNHSKDALYARLWELAVEDDEPHNKEEEEIKENSKGNTKYFSMFKNKEGFVTYSSTYWCYAFVDANGWHDMDEAKNSNAWITEFNDKYLSRLNDDDLITIYECSTNDDHLI